jgi:hypothetical protein
MIAMEDSVEQPKARLLHSGFLVKCWRLGRSPLWPEGPDGETSRGLSGSMAIDCECGVLTVACDSFYDYLVA